MATGKRYYWIKLKDDFFADDGPIDFLMGNGAEYVVLYLMLCIKAINTDGRLSNQIGEVVIPYDVEKIRRTCKYFSADTVRVALNLYKVLGLVYEDVDGTLVIVNHNKMVGSETDWAEKRRRQRLAPSDTPALPDGDSPGDNGGDIGRDNSGDNVPIDIKRLRDKENREYRDKILDTRYSEEEYTTRTCASEVETAFGRVMSFYIDKINATPSQLAVDGLKEFCEELPPDVILHAFSIALDERKTTWSYIRGILRRYTRDGLTSLTAVQESERQYHQRMENKWGNQTASRSTATSAMDDLYSLHQMFAEEDHQ